MTRFPNMDTSTWGLEQARWPSRPPVRKPLRYGLTAAAVMLLGGCGASIGGEGVETGTLTLPGLPTLESFDFSLPPGQRAPVGTPPEIYSRIARGLLTCWLGAHGGLRGTHVFHATSEPARKGGRSNIVLHERDKSRPGERGKQSVRIQIAPDGASASIGFRNLTLSEDDGNRMKIDVYRWAANHEGCLPEPVNEGWEATAAQKSEKAKKR